MQQRRVKSRVAGNEVEYKSLTIPLGQKCRAAPTLGGHATFRILFFLRYVVDIGKSSPNPKFF